MFADLTYIYLSGAHKTLPKAEVLAIAEAEGIAVKVLLDLDQLLVLFSSSELVELIKLRSAYSRRVGTVLWLGHSKDLPDGIREAADALRHVGINYIKMEYRDLRSLSEGPKYDDVVDELSGAGIKLVKDCGNVVDIIVSQGVAVVGLRRYEIKVKDFLSRWTSERPVYMPGALNPDISRIFVNLSRASIKKRTTYYDPFCGTGSFLLEACYMGLRYVGSDIDERYVAGASKNLIGYGCEPEVFVADACRVPVREVGAIGTDMPYGRQTKPHGIDIRRLITCFLENAESALRRGSYLVFAQDSRFEDEVHRALDRLNFKLVEVHRNWVHGSLTRNIYVLRRT